VYIENGRGVNDKRRCKTDLTFLIALYEKAGCITTTSKTIQEVRFVELYSRIKAILQWILFAIQFLEKSKYAVGKT
jgi:hypothetical protein